MGIKKIECNSQANLVAITKATWNIAEFYGPLQYLMRSAASCFVSLEESPTEAVDLLLYLRYVENQNDPAKNDSSGYPMCRSIKKFSGYSLMVDVLSDHTEKLMISVTARKSDGDNSNFEIKRDGVLVEPNSCKTGLTAIKVFHRCETWEVDSDGDVNSYEMLDTNIFDSDLSTSDKKFNLTVAVYKLENAGHDYPKVKPRNAAQDPLVSGVYPNPTVIKFEPINVSDMVLTSMDGKKIHTHQFMLAAQSPYFFRWLKTGTTSLTVDVDSKPLLALLHYLYNGEFQEDFQCYIKEVLEAAAKFEMFSVLKTMDDKLIEFANPTNMLQLAELAENYRMEKATEDLAKFINSHTSFQEQPKDVDTRLQNERELNQPKPCSSFTSTSSGEQMQLDANPGTDQVFDSSLIPESGAAQPCALNYQHFSSSRKETCTIKMDQNSPKTASIKRQASKIVNSPVNKVIPGETSDSDLDDWMVVARREKKMKRL